MLFEKIANRTTLTLKDKFLRQVNITRFCWAGFSPPQGQTREKMITYAFCGASRQDTGASKPSHNDSLYVTQGSNFCRRPELQELVEPLTNLEPWKKRESKQEVSVEYFSCSIAVEINVTR